MAIYPKLIMDALAKVRYPGTGKDLVEMGMVEDNIRIEGKKKSRTSCRKSCSFLLFTNMYPLSGCHIVVAVVDLFDYVFCQFAESCSGDRVGIQSDRCSVVASFADTLYDGDLS